jgi:hypothetical protein
LVEVDDATGGRLPVDPHGVPVCRQFSCLGTCFDRLANRDSAVDAIAARAITDWLNLTDARTARGSAAADLLDGIGSAARGEVPSPDQSELARWLELLNRLLGSSAEND